MRTLRPWRLPNQRHCRLLAWGMLAALLHRGPALCETADGIRLGSGYALLPGSLGGSQPYAQISGYLSGLGVHFGTTYPAFGLRDADNLTNYLASISMGNHSDTFELDWTFGNIFRTGNGAAAKLFNPTTGVGLKWYLLPFAGLSAEAGATYASGKVEFAGSIGMSLRFHQFFPNSYAAQQDRAMSAIRRTEAESPGDYVAMLQCGNVLYVDDMPLVAIEAYNRAIKLDPDRDDAYFGLGNAWAKLGSYPKALAAYKKPSELRPSKHKGYTGLVLHLLSLNLPPDLIDVVKADACAAFQQACELDPKELTSALENARLIARKWPSAALSTYQQVIKMAPTNPHALHGLGLALYQEARISDAQQPLVTAADLEAANAQYQCDAAAALFAAKQYTEASTYYHRALSIAPADESVIAKLGGALAAAGRTDEALKVTAFGNQIRAQRLAREEREQQQRAQQREAWAKEEKEKEQERVAAQRQLIKAFFGGSSSGGYSPPSSSSTPSSSTPRPAYQAPAGKSQAELQREYNERAQAENRREQERQQALERERQRAAREQQYYQNQRQRR